MMMMVSPRGDRMKKDDSAPSAISPSGYLSFEHVCMCVSGGG